MAYADDIDALGPDHAFSFDGNATDRINALATTTSTVTFTGVALCEGVSVSMLTDAIDDQLQYAATSATFNGVDQNRLAAAGWFSVTATQNPPKQIMQIGDTTSVKILLGWGNNLMFEADAPNAVPAFLLQVFGDKVLASNRAYHLCMILECNTFGNEFRCYLDGVKQLGAEPADREPDAPNFPSRSAGTTFGIPASNGNFVGGDSVGILSPINGQYNEWALFDGANAVLTDTEIREELFEKGALADVTITSGTQAAMQTQLDTLADSVRADAPLCIRVEALSGGGDFTLTADNITFSPLASIHVQYTGTDTLTWINSNGSDASISSTPNGGTLTFVQGVPVTITCRDAITQAPVTGARVFLEDASNNILLNEETDTNGVVTISYSFTSNTALGARSKVRKGTTSPFYKTSPISGTIRASGLSVTVLLVSDE